MEERQSNICPTCLLPKQPMQETDVVQRILEQEGRIYYDCSICNAHWYVTPSLEQRKEVLAQLAQR